MVLVIYAQADLFIKIVQLEVVHSTFLLFLHYKYTRKNVWPSVGDFTHALDKNYGTVRRLACCFKYWLSHFSPDTVCGYGDPLPLINNVVNFVFNGECLNNLVTALENTPVNILIAWPCQSSSLCTLCNVFESCQWTEWTVPQLSIMIIYNSSWSILIKWIRDIFSGDNLT